MLEWFYQALQSPRGIRISTEDRERLRQRLYSERRAAEDPALAAIAIVFPVEENELWLVRKEPEDAGS